MTIDTIKRAIMFVVLCLAQALVFNHVYLLGCATVLVYVYFVITFPRNYPRWAALLWSFCLGLSVDMFSNTPGLTAASLTLVAFLQPYLLDLLIPREAPENLKSSMLTLGFTKFLYLTSVLTLVLCLVLFSLESFGFFNWMQWALNIAGSFLLTVIVVMALESIRK